MCLGEDWIAFGVAEEASPRQHEYADGFRVPARLKTGRNRLARELECCTMSGVSSVPVCGLETKVIYTSTS